MSLNESIVEAALTWFGVLGYGFTIRLMPSGRAGLNP